MSIQQPIFKPIFKIAFFLLALFVVLVPHYQIAAQPSALFESPFLDVFVSSDYLSQADTLLVVVKNEPNKVSGSLGQVQLRFFRDQSGNNWVALVAMPNSKKPGDYILSLKGSTKIYQRIIKISKKSFPITHFPTNTNLLSSGFTAKRVISAINNEENPVLQKFLGYITPISYVSKPFIYPLSEVTVTGPAGEYGVIRKFGTYQIQHVGSDLKASVGTPVFAVNDGLVVFSRPLKDYGNTLVIDHGLGVYSLYLHLSEFKAKEESFVKQGDVIGLAGESGYATGPHLHFSIKVRMVSVDPLKFIDATQSGY